MLKMPNRVVKNSIGMNMPYIKLTNTCTKTEEYLKCIRYSGPAYRFMYYRCVFFLVLISLSSFLKKYHPLSKILIITFMPPNMQNST